VRPLGACGRADLVRALRQSDQEMAQIAAELLGFDAVPKVSMTIASTPHPVISIMRDDADGHEPAAEPEAPAQPLADIPFWYVDAYETLTPAETVEQPVEPAEIEWTNRPTEPPRVPLLAPWRELQARLRCEAAQWHETRALDVPAVVATLTRGRQIGRIPYERRRRWGPRLHIIADRSDRLIPYWADQEATGHALGKLLASHQIERAAIWEGLSAPRLLNEGPGFCDYRLPPPGSLVLVLGDLGCLADGDGELQNFWLGFGRCVADAGCHPVALLPCPPQRCAQALRDLWRLLPWARSPGAVVTDPEQRRQRAERLLCLVSPALRIEPGFLRAVRLLLPAGESDSGTESDVWQHPALTSDSAAAATLAPDKAKEYRAEFAKQPKELQTQVLALLRIWRGGLPKEIWFEEIQSLEAVSHALLPEEHKDKDLELARRFFVQFSQRARGLASGGVASGSLAWYRRCERRLTAAAYADAEVGKALNRLSVALHKEDKDFQPDRSFLPSDAPPDRIRRLAVSQVADQLQFIEQADMRVLPTVGSPLGTVESGNGWVKFEPQTDSVFETESVSNDFWETGQPPPWADAWGRDGDGAWVEFSVKGKDGVPVSQTMRWIEPGSFMMGSPETEAERFDDEGPQHEVNIKEGYWLFDTACTQALWNAVIGDNPSSFKGADRPVERVSWDDAQGFISQLNKLMPGLDLGLPSEAQWEYACRAGTTTPFSFDGGNITPEQVNYNGEYPYAGGAKGIYRKETVPVKSMPANPWGLYEMHGNVREWVQDAWHGNYNGAPTDGSVWESAEAGAGRVLRGGSWNSGAWSCRSAYRYYNQPDSQISFIGFRCARVQGRESGKPAAGRPRQTRSGASQSALARPAGEMGELGRNKPAPAGVSGKLTNQLVFTNPAEKSARSQALAWEPAQRGETTLLRLDTTTTVTAPLPQCRAFAILTDREKLTLRQTTQPPWAVGVGRDRFGLWADIAIEVKQGEPVIQRLRWIPPGRFMMGSPNDEPGRWEAEGPQQLVTISQGYWLFDTPCTQALWLAVVGENPSRFQDPARPVEKVSWDDIQQRFLPALNERIPGFILPNEAQWEYACRAGTDTALYTGDMVIRGDMDAPLLDPIAWYGGNSGLDYDLSEAEDTTKGWWEGKRKQYDDKRAGTRKVKGKLPNPWGLYDMLGNVWEWVEDPWHSNYEGAPIDGKVWAEAEAGAGRVLRGGSWYNDARYCRSACRSYSQPDYQYGLIGFRCARVQA
jgi:formylglycine-generating enzyme required for sulfatase activity